MQPPEVQLRTSGRTSADDRGADERDAGDCAPNRAAGELGVEALVRDARRVRRDRVTLDQLRQQVASALPEPRRQQEQDGAAVRPRAQRDQVLVDREVALSMAWILSARVHELLEQTQEHHLEAAADRRERHTRLRGDAE